MTLRLRRVALLALLALGTALIPAARPALAATLVVNSTADDADAADGDGLCATASGACTLRAALTTADDVAGADTINFNIPTSDSGYSATLQVWSIRPATALPAITEAGLTIDGSSQPIGRASGPRIELDGSLMTSVVAGLQVQASSVTIRSLVINRFRRGSLGTGGIGIYFSNDSADNGLVTGCWIGVDAAGTGAAGNEAPGVWLRGDSNVVRSNVISGNGAASLGRANVMVGQPTSSDSTGYAEGNIVAGNLIGTNAAGTAIIPGGNIQDGVLVANFTRDTTIGGATAADRNVIVGHAVQDSGTSSGDRAGIRLEPTNNSSSTVININTVVRGNYIGVLPSGSTAGPNANGVFIRNDVDGALVVGNVISGNDLSGVMLEGQNFTQTGVVVQENLIGLSASGAALGNLQSGVTFGTQGSAAAGVSSTSILSNTISANGQHGILIGSQPSPTAPYTGNLIRGNAIGTAVGGMSTSSALLNGQSGVAVLVGSATIAENVIAARATQAAVRLGDSASAAPSSGSTVRDNMIGLGADGLTTLGTITANQASFGVLVEAGSGSNVIGPGNVIGSVSAGVQLSGGSANSVRGNTIGYDDSGNFARGPAQFGVWVLNSTSNTIGGSGASDGNLIGNSGLTGVYIDGTSGSNTIAGNSIRNSGEDGLLLNSAGATGTIIERNVLSGNQRDGLRITAATGVRVSETATSGNVGSGISLQSGANGGRAAPTLAAALTIGPGGEPRITGTASGCSSPGCVVEIFSGASRDDGEGPRFVASGTADPSSGAFSIDVSGCDRFLSATARDPITNNTSAFSTPMVDTTTGCAQATPELSAGTPATTSGAPRVLPVGSTATYTHTLRNTGGLVGTFSLSASSGPQGWPTSVAPASVALAAGQSTTITVTVDLPAGARGGAPPEQTTVTATAGSRSASASDYTQAQQIYAVNIEPPLSLQFTPIAAPVVLTYTHVITNTGNGADTIAIAATNSTIAGSPGFSYPSGSQCASLAPGASCTRTVRLTLPASSAGGTFTVTATGGGGASDSVVDTAFSQSAIPELTSFAQRDALPGATVQFVHTLRNSGNQSGVFTPTLTLPAPLDGWSYQLTPSGSVSLAPNATATLTVTAVLPGVGSTGAISGTIKSATLGVTSSSGAVASASDAVRVLLQPAFSLSVASLTPAQGQPGTTVVFTHTLQNLSNGDDRYTVVVTPTADLESVSVTPSSPVAVARGGSASVVIRARIAPGALASVGTQRLDVTAQSVSLPRPAPVTRQDAVTVLGATVPALSVAPASRTVTPGSAARFSYTLTNIGNQGGSFSQPSFTLPGGWSAAVVAPAPACLSATIAPSGTCQFDVDVSVPAGAIARSYAVAAAVSSLTTPSAPQASAASTVVVSAVPGVAFTPSRSSTAAPGALVSYTHLLTNTGNLTETYTFSVTAPSGWLVPTPAAQASVPPGGVRTVVVQVTSPAAIAGGSQGVVSVTARAATSPNPTATVVDTTTIASIDGAALNPAAQTTGGAAGDTVQFYPQLRNSGSTAIAYDLSVSAPGWQVSVAPASTGVLAPGASLPLTVSVTIPPSVGLGQSDTATLLVRKAGGGAVLATGLYTATTAVVGSLLTPSENRRTALPGATVIYTHTLRNPTAQADTFTLRGLSTNGWPVSVAPASVFLAPGASQEIAVTLQIPNARAAGEQDYAYVEVQALNIVGLGGRGTEISTVARVAGAQLSPDQSLIVAPSQSIELQHTLLNSGNELDTFTISVTDERGWPVTVSVPASGQVTLLRGATFPVEVQVSVPAGVARGTLNRVTVRATSQFNPLAGAQVVHTLAYPALPALPPRYEVRLPLVLVP